MVAGEGCETWFIGTAHHEGALLPGKVHPTNGICYVPWCGKEIPKREYQVLSSFNGTWIKVAGCNLPQNAVQGGMTANGQPLFIGRIEHVGSKIPGKVDPSNQRLYVPCCGVEIPYDEFEILVN
ncbi:uncharacterized protein LOC106637505 [Copidosoma floridanum]|uniref:uncharacterized protein LOC106637505 n=1 Tax=Copidosoma floridanum TaxID=29053 RepID=UPI0006C966AC|nr:uncharacterized protein LOC106637505 [Copidosoma floridanum]